ncbi:MAG: hypothetical protein ACR2O4_03205 [Hyphomicrobiaceae bacterium]
MRFGLLGALIFMIGGFLGSTAYISGEELNHLSEAQMLALGESAVVILTLLLPSLLLLGVILYGGARRFVR